MKQNSASYYSMKCLHILFFAVLYIVAAEGHKFHVQVLPADYTWNVSVRCKDCHYMNPQNTDGSNYLTFDVSSYNKKGIEQIKVTIESAGVIKDQIRSQKWTLNARRNGNKEGNFFDFGKLHQFNFGQFKPEGQNFFLDIKAINANELQQIPEEFKKYFASISGFKEEIELSRGQFYGAKLIRLDLMGKTSKPKLLKTLSSLSPSSKNLFRSSSSKSGTTSRSEPSAIEKYITKYANPELKVSIYMKVKCGMCGSDENPFAKDVVYKIDHAGYYRCKSCKDEYMNTKNVYHSPTIEKFKLPSLSRTIRNPILQNGNGLGFTYIFDFGEGETGENINYVQLVDVPPNNSHNESTSSHVPEYGFQTPEHPTNIFTDFQNLNLGGGSYGNGGNETERPNFAAMHGGQGTRLNFDEASNSSGSSGKKSRGRPPKHVSPQTTHGDAQPNLVKTRKGAQPKMKKVSSMPVERGNLEPEDDTNNSGDSSDSNSVYSNFGGGLDHDGQSVQTSGGMPYPGYGFHNNGEQYSYGAFGGMYNHGGADKTFHRSASMPVHNNGGQNWDGNNGGQSWTGNNGGQCWTGNNGGQCWTGNSGGQNWDGNNGGQSWTGNNGGQCWTGNNGGQCWTGNSGGQNWDGNNGGQSWTGNNREQSWDDNNGRQSWYGNNGVQSWDVNNGGQNWFGNNGGQNWDGNHEGQNWDGNHGVHTWTGNNGGHSWNENNGEQGWNGNHGVHTWTGNHGGYNSEQQGYPPFYGTNSSHNGYAHSMHHDHFGDGVPSVFGQPNDENEAKW